MSILNVSDLYKRFGGVQAVDGLSFAVERGEILGLIGPNGSGKSTSLSLVMGILRPDRGVVTLNDMNISGMKPHVISRLGMAMMFQHSRPLYSVTVAENVALALMSDRILTAFFRTSLDERVSELANLVGLADVLHRDARALAFADVRRLELAKAIAREPRVLLLDEPFAGLAPKEAREFSDLIASLRDRGCAIVLVDHNVPAVTRLAGRVVAMSAGAQIAEGTPSEVTSNSTVREVYFGKPVSERVQPSEPEEEDIAGSVLLSVDIQRVTYGQIEALRDVTLRVGEGQFVGIVGLNGAGKSTLLRTILGFVPYQGTIQWKGQPVRGNDSYAIARMGIALCPETRELFGAMTVRENLELGGHRLSKSQFRAQLERVFELFPRLSARTNQSANTLSGGERQMLTIGRALMQMPTLLLLDEPTLGLAPLIIERIAGVLDTLQRSFGLTILLAEQNLTFTTSRAQYIYLLESGGVRWQGPANRFVKEVGESIL